MKTNLSILIREVEEKLVFITENVQHPQGLPEYEELLRSHKRLKDFDTKLREGPQRFECFHCRDWFERKDAKICSNCGWLICPNCSLCLCQLEGESQVVAEAMWEGHMDHLKEILGEEDKK